MEDKFTTSSWYTSHLKRIYKEILLTMNALWYTNGRDISRTRIKEYGTNHEENDFGAAPMDNTA